MGVSPRIGALPHPTLMGDRRNSPKVKGNACAELVCYPGIHECTREAMSLTEKQDEKVQVCEINLVRRIVGVKIADKRRTDELGVEVGLIMRKGWVMKNWQREQTLRKCRGKEGK